MKGKKTEEEEEENEEEEEEGGCGWFCYPQAWIYFQIHGRK